MFEVPDAKRVRREELHDSTSDEEDTQDDQWDSALREKLNARLSGLLDLSFTADGNPEVEQLPQPNTGNANPEPSDDNDGGKEVEKETFTFRLFRDEEPSRKVVLEPQTADREKNGGGGFVVARRPISYYLASEPTPEIAQKFRMAAVSADYLIQDAKKRRWGLEKPWKVTTITVVTNEKRVGPSVSVGENVTSDAGKKRKRPGKKRRIILRVRERAKKEREEAAKQQLVEKEEHLKEKKKRLNRQKKLKRRAKGKEKKQGMKDDSDSEKSGAESPSREA